MPRGNHGATERMHELDSAALGDASIRVGVVNDEGSRMLVGEVQPPCRREKPGDGVRPLDNVVRP